MISVSTRQFHTYSPASSSSLFKLLPAFWSTALFPLFQLLEHSHCNGHQWLLKALPHQTYLLTFSLPGQNQPLLSKHRSFLPLLPVPTFHSPFKIHSQSHPINTCPVAPVKRNLIPPQAGFYLHLSNDLPFLGQRVCLISPPREEPLRMRWMRWESNFLLDLDAPIWWMK